MSVFSSTANGDIYTDFFKNQLPVLLADVSLHVWAQLIFQYYGAFSLTRLRFSKRVLSKKIDWFHDLATMVTRFKLDFFVWDYFYVRSLVKHYRNDTENAPYVKRSTWIYTYCNFQYHYARNDTSYCWHTILFEEVNSARGRGQFRRHSDNFCIKK